MAKYGVVETTFYNMMDRNFSMRSNVDIENGALVNKGELIQGNPYPNFIYEGKVPATGTLDTAPVFLVANPAWSYDTSRSVNRNEANYINVAESDYRTYELRILDKFAITDYSIDAIDGSTPLAVGQFVGLQADSTKMKASAAEPSGSAFVGKIVRIQERGFNFSVGQELPKPLTMVTVEVLKNGPTV